VNWIETYRLIAVVRLDDLSCATELTAALLEGGVRVIEFTYTNREAGRAIEEVRRRFEGTCLVGAGTVL